MQYEHNSTRVRSHYIEHVRSAQSAIDDDFEQNVRCIIIIIMYKVYYDGESLMIWREEVYWIQRAFDSFFLNTYLYRPNTEDDRVLLPSFFDIRRENIKV